MIILNVLALLALPFIFSSAFEITEVSTRMKLRAVEKAGGFDQEKVAPFLSETKEHTGYKHTCDAMGAWLTKDQPWRRALLIPSFMFLVLNTLALYISGRNERSKTSANNQVDASSNSRSAPV